MSRPVGRPTRGTTAPNRLRRVDRFIAARFGRLLRSADDPLVVDLGYGEHPVTTVELYRRLRAVRPDVRVVGLEIDAARVAAAEEAAEPPGLTFARGGFELSGHRSADRGVPEGRGDGRRRHPAADPARRSGGVRVGRYQAAVGDRHRRGLRGHGRPLSEPRV